MTSSAEPKAPTLPVRQLFILSLCRLCEPIAFCSIFPYIYFMINSFKIAKNENEIAIYAGMVTSAFAFAEFTTGMMWGRISDKVGRKPILIGGLAGTLLSMLLFGFAKSFPVALLARAAGGFLNGNIGVIQTTVAEMVPEKSLQPRAYAIMPFIWCIGSIIGPAVGGALADPIKQYPEYFKPGGFLEEYPYALPNLFASAVLFIGVIFGILFLEETHAELKHKRDYGRELGEKLLALFHKNLSLFGGKPAVGTTEDGAPETRKLLGPQVVTTEAYDTFSEASSSTAASVDSVKIRKPRRPLGLKETFTPQIIHLVISYGILALHTIAFEQLFPVFLSTPEATEPPHHLFKFTGGFGLNTREIGLILTCQGVLAMLMQFLAFPPLVGYFGATNVYRTVMILYPISYFMVPYLDFLDFKNRYAGMYIVLVIKILFGCLSYPCNTILLTNSAPSLLVLGSINGVAASIASLARSFGPTLSGVIYAYGLDIGYVGLAWWVNAGVCIIGTIQMFMIKEPLGNVQDDLDELDEEAIEQAARSAAVHGTNASGGNTEECVDEYAIVRGALSHPA
ncbi:major facilitator superfamily domain-containing protein [Peziza echinospora]|nr:major facilitator superfamily domain-containing protein [Peziza echinospora]